METYTNKLIRESSLYLQQHAHNPVNWEPWSEEAFARASAENKLVLVSIGYSSCHWCHVMEHESFEDEEVAAIMNKFFVCIKVDREERPDVNQVYMTAVQLMTQRGGWPLNCFTLPDGKPVYGGTYFPKEQWMHILKSLQHTYAEQPDKVLQYAEDLKEGVRQSDLIETRQTVSEFPEDKLWELVRRWKPQMDQVEGGPTHAPKFPLPNNYQFLNFYGVLKADDEVLKHVDLTLNKMAFGGIYDQVGGGFSRYSVDLLWKIPHFEKMLYDNGQLLQLYALAYKRTLNPEYKRVLDGTLTWLEREMLSPEGALYAAQDADSEGEEGKYYVWQLPELKAILGTDFSWFSDFFNPRNKGYWEHDNYVLIRNESWESFLKKNPDLSAVKISNALDSLLHERRKRIAPVTDTKCLTAWNALSVSGLLEAYHATEEAGFLKLALQIGDWILRYQLQADHTLFHTRQNGKSFTTGFLDDYATVIQAFTDLYQTTGQKIWLEEALNLAAHTLAHFYDERSGMFFFTPDDSGLIARKMELNDNVIPATNSIMAHNLLTLSELADRISYEGMSKQMLANLVDGMEQYGSGYSNWALLLLRLQAGIQMINIPQNRKQEADLSVLSPFVLFRYVDEPDFSVCAGQQCSLPLNTWEAVLHELNR